MYSCLVDGCNVLIPLCDWCQGPTEKEQIDVQGDISYDIVEFITDTWPDVSDFDRLLFDIII